MNLPAISWPIPIGFVKSNSRVPDFISSEKDFMPKAGSRKTNNHGLSSKNKLISPSRYVYTPLFKSEEFKKQIRWNVNLFT